MFLFFLFFTIKVEGPDTKYHKTNMIRAPNLEDNGKKPKEFCFVCQFLIQGAGPRKKQPSLVEDLILVITDILFNRKARIA